MKNILQNEQELYNYVVNKFRDEKVPAAELAKECGVHLNKIRAILRKHGLYGNKETILKNMGYTAQDIIELFKEDYNIKSLNKKTNINDQHLRDILTENNFYTNNEEVYDLIHKNKQKKIRKTCIERYGEDNISKCMSGKQRRALHSRNSIPYKRFDFIDEYAEYCRKSKRYIEKSIKEMIAPDYCEYTGIKFADATNGGSNNVNPNDPLKRSIDHKMSLLECYLKGISVEEANSPENLAFCIRYVNTIKQNNSLGDYSLQEMIKIIREKLINENYEYI